MDSELSKQVRIEQTHHELLSLSGDITDWLKRRRVKDSDQHGRYVGRHKTQLEVVESVLMGAAEALHENLRQVTQKSDAGEVYEQCRDFDYAIVWLRRLWEYFQEKFDQRDHERIGSVLRAADEVVWSCYRQVFAIATQREPGLKPGPAPLAFIEPEYSPAAVQSDKPLPPSLRLSADVDFLDAYLKTLPIPVLRLPPWCIDAPWWLIFIGHEVGHHVQHDLKLIGYFRSGMERSARAQGLSAEDVALWGGWGEEVFADVFSVCVMGPSAVWSVAEVERSTPAEMIKRKDAYPAPVVRLALLAHAADKLGMDGTKALRGLDLCEMAAGDEVIKRDMTVVEGAVEFALGEMPGKLGRLQELCGLDSGLDAEVTSTFMKQTNHWSRLLREQTTPVVPQELKTARLVMSGAMSAWGAVMTEADADVREAARRNLIQRTKETLIKSGEPGTRTHMAPVGEVPEKGKELAELLLKARAARQATPR